jgi:hypothetical protein
MNTKVVRIDRIGTFCAKGRYGRLRTVWHKTGIWKGGHVTQPENPARYQIHVEESATGRRLHSLTRALRQFPVVITGNRFLSACTLFEIAAEF